MRFMRMEDGVRVPWIFEVEQATMLIVKEYRQHEQEANMALMTPPKDETPVERTLRRMQVQYRREPAGGMTIMKTTKTSQLVDKVLDLQAECPAEFPDCARLRQMYAAEVDRLPKDGTGECRQCDVNDVRRKYTNYLLDMLGVK